MRKEDMIEGNWYAGKFATEKWIFKFDYLNKGGDVFETLAGTPDDGFICRNGFLSGLKIKTLREATIEEVHKLFPKEEYKQMTNYEIY
jgi:hypothetical protein